MHCTDEIQQIETDRQFVQFQIKYPFIIIILRATINNIDACLAAIANWKDFLSNLTDPIDPPTRIET